MSIENITARKLLDYNPNGWNIFGEAVKVKSQIIKLVHDNFYNVRIYSNPEKTQLVSEEFYTLVDYNEDLDAYNSIILQEDFYNAYKNQYLYVDYDTKGDFVQADDVNSKQEKIVVIEAQEQIDQYKVVSINDEGKAVVASIDDLSTKKVIGIQLETVSEGEYLQIQVQGNIKNSSWQFTPGSEVYLINEGGLSDSMPSSGLFNVQLGIAVEIDTIQLRRMIPLFTSENIPGTLVYRDENGDFAQGTITQDLIGNQQTQSKLEDEVQISLSGDLDGQTMFDGSKDVVIDAEIVKIAGMSIDEIVRIDGRSKFVTQPNNLMPGWYTVAVNVGDRQTARFALIDTSGGHHQSVVFYASHLYQGDNQITIEHQSCFDTPAVTKIRMLAGETYDGQIIQIYVNQAVNKVSFFLLGDNFQPSGWIIKNFVPDGSDPGNLNDFTKVNVEVLTVDLEHVNKNGSIYSSGNIQQAGDVIQTRVFGAVFNDYQEYRVQNEEIKPGYVAVLEDNGKIQRQRKDRQRNIVGVVSDVYGTIFGYIADEINVPIQVAGRVLAYVEEPLWNLKPGDQLCSTKNGKLRKMKWWEKILFPEQIVGFVDEKPLYEEWGLGDKKVKVDGRIWIRLR